MLVEALLPSPCSQVSVPGRGRELGLGVMVTAPGAYDGHTPQPQVCNAPSPRCVQCSPPQPQVCNTPRALGWWGPGRIGAQVQPTPTVGGRCHLSWCSCRWISSPCRGRWVCTWASSPASCTGRSAPLWGSHCLQEKEQRQFKLLLLPHSREKWAQLLPHAVS